MDVRMFMSLPEVEDMIDLVNPPLHYMFLTGEHIIGQKVSKQPGQLVSYYVVTSVNEDGGFQYKTMFEKLTGGQ